ncbi:MAG: regulatory protein RecX [Candidatus Kappaea frigidicola]|nr:regulatory protein RecX [Candidatus Kappaea frigidicola]
MTKELNKKALNYSYRLLKIRLRSSQELKDKLDLKGYSVGDIEAVLKHLMKTNQINDELFAKCWINDRMNLNPKAPSALSMELEKKGISKDIIDKALLKSSKDYNFDNLALELATQRLATLKTNTNPEIAKKRIFDYLSHRGFDGQIIYDVIEELI